MLRLLRSKVYKEAPPGERLTKIKINAPYGAVRRRTAPYGRTVKIKIRAAPWTLLKIEFENWLPLWLAPAKGSALIFIKN